MTEKELHKLFENKLKGHSVPFNEDAWQSMEQMLDPKEPLSEIEYRKLFSNKLAAASFPFNPDNWNEMEVKLNEEQGAMSKEELSALFNKKFGAQTVGFNSANWQKMEAILDANAKKPLLYFWRSAAAILLFALGSLGFHFSELPRTNNLNSGETISASPLLVEPAIAPSLESQTIARPAPSGLRDETIAVEGTPASTSPPMVPPVNSVAGNFNPQNQPSASQLAAPFTLVESSFPLALILKNNNLTVKPWRTVGFENPGLTVLDPSLVDESTLVASTKKPVPYIPVAYTKLSVVGGPSINPGYNGRLGSGFSAGLDYEYGFNEKSSISVGLLFNYGGDMGIESLSDSTFFGLTRTEVQTHSHYKNISALRLPLSFNFKVSPKHSFSVGAYADAIVAVRFEEQKTTTIFKQDPTVENKSGLAPKNSFTSFSGGAQLGYSYQYTEGLSIGISYQHGLGDLSNDAHQNLSKHHQTSQTNLVLKYSIWER
jgi:hypothetical protein